MAEFQIQTMGEGAGKVEDLPRQGLVNEVCREWLVHEDQALAERLQTEEFEHHLGHNRSRNALLRQDTPHARAEQLREDEEAARIQAMYDEMLAQQEEDDALAAAELAQQLEEEEWMKKTEQEEKDRHYAKQLVEREKANVRQNREMRQVEKEAAYLGINTGHDNVALLSQNKEKIRTGGEEETQASGSSTRSSRSGANSISSDLSDLSDFCIQPSREMDEDEELARLLQEQDLKRRGDLMDEDKLMAIEVQDRELAKVLQEQERMKARKAREKARQKALLKKQERLAAQMKEGQIQKTTKVVENGTTSSPSGSVTPSEQPGPSGRSPSSESPSLESPRYETPFNGTHSPRQSNPSSPRHQVNESLKDGRRISSSPLCGTKEKASTSEASPVKQHIPQRPNTLDLNGAGPSSTSRGPQGGSGHAGTSYPVGKTNKPRLPDPDAIEVVESYGSPEPCPTASGFTNIACAIDPTYQRRVQRGEFSSPSSSTSTSTSTSSSSGSNSNYHLHMPNGTAQSSVSSPISPLPPPVFDDDDDYPVPPYMPIQGQRRTASLEKCARKARPPKEKGNTKEGCKQQ
ncbi:uncharacterized protein LOC143020816 isoform X2 [Oratosquilla oratoria]|uniref:uncharacterized protein LOC143020816 isoform X2 n=1 Tax=Oratosquilla oratoria TaxID=337810 RepID=UPI003F76C985